MYFNENSIIYLDGRYVKSTDVSVNLYMQTLHYGYGVFEGLRAYDTNQGPVIFKSEDHFIRLKRSCELINIPLSYSIEELHEIASEVLRKNTLTEAYIRPLVFCDPNMSLTRPNKVSLMIAAWKWNAYLGDKLLKVMISSYCRPHPRSVNIESKACGYYVNSILSSTEAKDEGYDEALLLDHEGYLAEGPGANLFFEKDGILFTPQKGSIMPGITRATVMEICREKGIDCREGLFKPSDIFNADGAFYCGTAAEIVGIHSVNGIQFRKQWHDTKGKFIQEAYSKKVRRHKLINADFVYGSRIEAVKS